MFKHALCAAIAAFFTLLNSSLAHASIMPLPANSAFRVEAEITAPKTVTLTFNIARGYYLYRDRLQVKSAPEVSSSPAALTLEPVSYPNGIAKDDSFLGPHQVYQDNINIPVNFSGQLPGNASLLLTYQGCATSGFCYPPIARVIHVALAPNIENSRLRIEMESQSIATEATPALSVVKSAPRPDVIASNGSLWMTNAPSHITALFSEASLPTLLLAFFGFGVLLAFTPCVLPMIPILSGIILGSKEKLATKKAFLLSLTYVLAMACTYAVAGVLAGYLGAELQAFMQSPWILIIFSLIFVGLALSLFGCFELKLPEKWTNYLIHISQKQRAGSYLGVFVMGILATLIVSPCVTPPLVGALSYITHTGNSVLGGLALFVMGLGMGVPLLIIGASMGQWLPRAGSWLERVKAVFGVLLLATALGLMSRILPGPMVILLFGFLFIGCSVFLNTFDRDSKKTIARLEQTLGIILLVYGTALIWGAAKGNSELLAPLRSPVVVGSSANQPARLLFHQVTTEAELNDQLNAAKQQKQPVMIDVTADWCVSCARMKDSTFVNSDVIAALKPYRLLQIDMSKPSPELQAMLTTWHIIAPPTLIFINAEGTEQKSARLVGEVSAKTLVATITAIQ